MMLSLVQASTRLNPAMACPRAPMVPGRITALATSSIRQSRSLLPCHEPLQSRRAFSSLTTKEVLYKSSWLLMCAVAGAALGVALYQNKESLGLPSKKSMGIPSYRCFPVPFINLSSHPAIKSFDRESFMNLYQEMIWYRDIGAIRELVHYVRSHPELASKIQDEFGTKPRMVKFGNMDDSSIWDDMEIEPSSPWEEFFIRNCIFFPYPIFFDPNYISQEDRHFISNVLDLFDKQTVEKLVILQDISFLRRYPEFDYLLGKIKDMPRGE